MKFTTTPALLIFATFTLCLSAAPSSAGPQRSPVDCVDPMIGALTDVSGDACGKTYPGPATPFGMVQLSPDTVTGGDNGSGYSSDMNTIEGFSFTHMSGVGWYGEFGNLQVMPEVGDLVTDRDSAKSPYDKQSEVAQAGYYRVLLRRYGVTTELTDSPHAGILRFTFPAAAVSRIKVDLTRRIGGDGAHSTTQYVRQVDDRTFEGWMKCDPSGKGWGHGAGRVSYTLYFSLQTSVPAQRFGTWDGADVSYALKERTGAQSGFFVEFPTQQGQQVLLKAGISFVSIDNARANLAHEIAGWDFDGVHRANRALWSQALGGVTAVGGTDDQQTIFYTSLYHALLDPRSITDIDGEFASADGQPHKADGWTDRTCFSGWDVYRAEFPLLNLIEPRIVSDEIDSLMEINTLGSSKGLARWELMGRDTPIMLGDPALSVISDAYLKGIGGFDVGKAYQMCLQVAQGPAQFSNRNDFAHWSTIGYCTEKYGVSQTMENAYDDYALGRFAEALGKTSDSQRLFQTALNYRNVFDPSVGWFRARDADGAWRPWTGRLTSGGCVESNPEQQGWFVPQDVAGLIQLVGGDAEFIRQLNELFENTPPSQMKKWNDWYNHSNEPVHQCAFLFTYAGAPWLTQKWSRYVCDTAYGTGPTGLCGNDDVGQMSAWYVFASSGLYPVSPTSNAYIIGSPLFDRVTFHLGANHKTAFSIVANNNSADNVYIQSAMLNGKPLQRAWLTYDEIARGGTLDLQMGPQPNTAWGSDPTAAPPSLSATASQAPTASAPLSNGQVKQHA